MIFVINLPGPTYPDSGVYCIRNILTRDVYIGSSKQIKHRWETHKSALRGGTHHARHLQRAWSKYGESAFRFVVLSYLPTSDLIQAEQWWFDNATCAYNGSRQAYRIDHTDEVRARISEKVLASWTPERRARTSAALKIRLKVKPDLATTHLAALHSSGSKAKVKAAHRERNRIYSAFGKVWCLKELAEEYGVRYGMLKDRVRSGWDIELAVVTPKRKGGL